MQVCEVLQSLLFNFLRYQLACRKFRYISIESIFGFTEISVWVFKLTLLFVLRILLQTGVNICLQYLKIGWCCWRIVIV